MEQPPLPRTAPLWGAIAGIGAHLIAAALVLTVLFTAQPFISIENAPIFFTAFAVASLTGMVVAVQRGGRSAAFVFAVYCVVGMGLDVIQTWIAEESARMNGGCCFVVQSTAQVALWQLPAIAGLALAPTIANRLRAMSRPAHTILEAAGIYSLASLPVFTMMIFVDPGVAPFEAVHAPVALHASIVILQGLLAGLVVAYRGTNSLRMPVAAGLVAIVGLLTVLFDDLSTLIKVPLYGWTYWPQSIVLVPAASAALVVLVLLARRAAIASGLGRPPAV